MDNPQDWQTESYKGMEIHVTALPHGTAAGMWDYAVRVVWPGEDPTSDSETVSQSGDDADYSSRQAALEAGFVKGHALVDELAK